MDGDLWVGIKWSSVNLLGGIPAEQWHSCSARYEHPILSSPGDSWSEITLKRKFIHDLK